MLGAHGPLEGVRAHSVGPAGQSGSRPGLRHDADAAAHHAALHAAAGHRRRRGDGLVPPQAGRGGRMQLRGPLHAHLP
eukprot:4350779-Pyramimonas_sp.AAC.1